jgi:hypothetical protein
MTKEKRTRIITEIWGVHWTLFSIYLLSLSLLSASLPWMTDDDAVVLFTLKYKLK